MKTVTYALHKLLPKPQKKPVVGTLAIENSTAYLFYDNGSSAETLTKIDVLHAGPDGFILRGYEPAGFEKNGRAKYKYQEWNLHYHEMKE